MAVKYETYTVEDVVARTGWHAATVRKYMHDGDFGDVKKMAKGMYKFPEGAIGNCIQVKNKEIESREKKKKIQDQKRAASIDRKNKNLKFIPRYAMHEASALAGERMEEEVAKHIKTWTRDLSEKEINFRKLRIEREFLHQLLAETDGVPREDLSDVEKRIALQAPVFMMDTLQRLSPDDMNYFLAELKKYYDMGHDIDSRPDVSFVINQLIFEQLGLKHTQTLFLVQEYSTDKDSEESMNRSMIRIDKLFKMLKECGPPEIARPNEGSSDGKDKQTGMY